MSTFFGGCFAALFWIVLRINPTLWMFFLWMLLFGLFFASTIFRLIETRYPPSFWVNVVVTMFILLGPAVADSANGDDVYKAFAIRLALFFVVTIYAWGAINFLEFLREGSMTRPESLASS